MPVGINNYSFSGRKNELYLLCFNTNISERKFNLN